VSSGQVAILRDVESDVRGRDVLLIDDILESGRTLVFAKDLLMARGARRVLTAVLLEKPGKRAVEIKADFVGFTCPDVFVVGYGMDVATLPPAALRRRRRSQGRRARPVRRRLTSWRASSSSTTKSRPGLPEARPRARRPRRRCSRSTAPTGSTGSAEAQGGFDLLLTDIRMPIMDGIALALAAKRDFPELVDPPHDRLRRPARARARARSDRGGRADEAVLARRAARRRDARALIPGPARGTDPGAPSWPDAIEVSSEAAMSQATTTSDHDEIRRWAEERGGRPSLVRTARGRGGILRFDFGEPEPNLEETSWEEFFRIFDESDLAFLHQDEAASGGTSRFFKFVARRPGRGRKGGAGRGSSSTKRASGGARGARGARGGAAKAGARAGRAGAARTSARGTKAAAAKGSTSGERKSSKAVGSKAGVKSAARKAPAKRGAAASKHAAGAASKSAAKRAASASKRSTGAASKRAASKSTSSKRGTKASAKAGAKRTTKSAAPKGGRGTRKG
jgi:CheY-like chemotaxis protein